MGSALFRFLTLGGDANIEDEYSMQIEEATFYLGGEFDGAAAASAAALASP
jgi:hypothetical protein